MTLERYHFDIDGKDFSLPKQIPFGALRKVRNLDPLGQVSVLLEELADADTLAELDKLPALDVAAKLKGWFQGAAPGESSSSSS